jgi:hypothetical protein
VNTLITYLLRLGAIMTMALGPGGTPLAGANAPQQSALAACQETPAPGGIAGTVRNSDGNGLPGVTVTAHATTGVAPVVGATNGLGEYVMALPPGSYRLEFKWASGPVQSIWYKSGSSPLDATAVEVRAGNTTDSLNVTLPGGARFNVALRDGAGAPVEQALIEVYDRLERKVAEGVTDAQGRALTVPRLPVGSYRLRARPAYGSPLLASYYNQRSTLDAADPITITQTAGSLEVAMTAQQGARLSGVVRDAGGAALPGIGVTATDSDGGSWFVMSDEQGRYSLRGLPSQSYQLEFRSYLTTPGAPAPLRRTVALVAPNEQAGFDAVLTAGGAITGRVTAPNGDPLPDIAVRVRDLNGAIDITATTAADGSYGAYGLPSGGYLIAYAAYGYGSVALAEPVTVTAPNASSVATTVLSAGGAISGKVTAPDGSPVAGVYVSVLDATGKPQSAAGYTNAEGVYATAPTLASGSYIVKFQPPSDGSGCSLAIEYSGNAASAASATKVQVSAPATALGVDATLEQGGVIAGQISDGASGAPLYGEVLVYDATGALVTNGNVSSLGYYRTSAGLQAGNYRLQFKAEGYVSQFYGGATRLEAATAVPSGSTEINMGLRRGATLTGIVTAADTGASLEHALVTVYGSGDRVVDSQLTAFDGSFSFSNSLPSGAYRIGVTPGLRADGTPFFSGYEAIFSGNARSLAQAQLISLAPSRSVSVSLAMPATGEAPATPTPAPPTPTPGGQRLSLPLLGR